jgi:hypothetical protein
MGTARAERRALSVPVLLAHFVPFCGKSVQMAWRQEIVNCWRQREIRGKTIQIAGKGGKIAGKGIQKRGSYSEKRGRRIQIADRSRRICGGSS